MCSVICEVSVVFLKNNMKNNSQWNKSKSFIESIRYAWRGVIYVLKSEPNFRIQLVVAGLVLILAWMLQLSFVQVSVLVITITLVVVMEVVNTVVEGLADVVHPDQHEEVRKVKDMMAGAVMLVSVSAIVVGLFVFVPSIVSLFV